MTSNKRRSTSEIMDATKISIILRTLSLCEGQNYFPENLDEELMDNDPHLLTLANVLTVFKDVISSNISSDDMQNFGLAKILFRLQWHENKLIATAAYKTVKKSLFADVICRLALDSPNVSIPSHILQNRIEMYPAYIECQPHVCQQYGQTRFNSKLLRRSSRKRNGRTGPLPRNN